MIFMSSVTSNHLAKTSFQQFARYRQEIIFLLFFVLGIILYLKPLNSDFLFWDDKTTIGMNPDIQKLTDLKRIWDGFNTRFLVGLSFTLNYCLGGPAAYGYRLVNLMLHIFTAFLIYIFAYLTFQNPLIQHQLKINGNQNRWLAFFCGAFFLCHPICTEAVNFITQRYVLMATFFYIAALIFYIKAVYEQKALYKIATLITILGAMFSKEFTITLPPMLFLYDLFFLNYLVPKDESTLNPKIGSCFFFSFKRVLPFLLTLFIIPLTLLRTSWDTTPTARITAIVPNKINQGIPAALATIDLTRAGGSLLSRKEYFLTQLHVIPTYLRLLVVPVAQNVDYDYPVSHHFNEASTIFFAVFLSFTLGLAFFLYARNRLAAFGILWIFLTLSVESSIFPIAHLIAEYRMYLPSVGFCLLLSTTLGFWTSQNFKKFYISASVIIIFFSILTYERNLLWSDQVMIWKDSVRKSPLKERPYANLGQALLENKRYDEGIVYLKKAVELDPDYAQGYLNLAWTYMQKKEFQQALPYGLKAAALSTSDDQSQRFLGMIYIKLNDLDSAIKSYEKAVLFDSGKNHALYDYSKLALLYVDKGDQMNALRYTKILRNFNYVDAAHNLEAIIVQRFQIHY